MTNDYATHGWELFDQYVAHLDGCLVGVEVRLRKFEAYVVWGMVDEHIAGCLCPPEDPSYNTDCATGTCGHLRQIRVGTFYAPWSRKDMVVEEYVGVEDRRLGVNIVLYAVYEKGQRPDLTTTVRELAPKPNAV